MDEGLDLVKGVGNSAIRLIDAGGDIRKAGKHLINFAQEGLSTTKSVVENGVDKINPLKHKVFGQSLDFNLQFFGKHADDGVDSGVKAFVKQDETVKYYRVQGGDDFTKKSYERIKKGKDGKVVVTQKHSTLYVSRETREHAEYYLKNRRVGGEVIEMEVPKWFDDFVMENIIEQENYTTNVLNQGGMAPYRVDKTMPGFALALPSPWTEWLEEYGKLK